MRSARRRTGSAWSAAPSTQAAPRASGPTPALSDNASSLPSFLTRSMIAARSGAIAGSGRERVGGLVPRALLDVHPRDRARDHELLGLGGALEEVLELGFAVPSSHQELRLVAVSAQTL